MRAVCIPVCVIAGLASSYAFVAEPAWLDVPFVQQTKAGCGAAAVAMVIGYWARQFRELSAAATASERIRELLPVSSVKGIQGEALKRYLDAHGFQSFVFNGELVDLRQHLAKGRPLIVCFAPAGIKAPLHYAVVVGLDERSVWLNDPARGKLSREDRHRFVSEWRETGGWTLLAVPRQQN
ncbi:MAG: C39 family peptidase [Acidobacteriaceae bacterium]|nr:C39 family peptidase [Acidobacteriaceae bacterium]